MSMYSGQIRIEEFPGGWALSNKATGERLAEVQKAESAAEALALAVRGQGKLRVLGAAVARLCNWHGRPFVTSNPDGVTPDRKPQAPPQPKPRPAVIVPPPPSAPADEVEAAWAELAEQKAEKPKRQRKPRAPKPPEEQE